MRGKRSFQPVLMELVIVTLFLALTTSVLARVLGAAGTMSKSAAFETEALLLLEDLMERTKADPCGDGAFDAEGNRAITETGGDGIAVTGRVHAAPYPSGVLYEIELSAGDGYHAPVQLTGARYVQLEGVGP